MTKTKKNSYGLSRHIPAEIRREVRRRSKFGCVICRSGFYQYEHIDPPFQHAREHHSDNICCLCGACHDAVSRKQLSKQMVKNAYQRVQLSSADEVPSPKGPLDFHDGNAELFIGGLLYVPAVRTIVRWHGNDLIRVSPGKTASEPGSISAVFTDDHGFPVLNLEENEWIGSRKAWDIEVVGQRITVRQKHKRTVLQLRLDPPGRIVVEKLDMRIHDSHVLITDQTYAVGRYISKDRISWVHALAHITTSSPFGAAIEFTSPDQLRQRDKALAGTGQEGATEDREIVMSANSGILIKRLGIAIASLCGGFTISVLATGTRKLSDMRKIIARCPDKLGLFIANGSTDEA